MKISAVLYASLILFLYFCCPFQLFLCLKAVLGWVILFEFVFVFSFAFAFVFVFVFVFLFEIQFLCIHNLFVFLYVILYVFVFVFLFVFVFVCLKAALGWVILFAPPPFVSWISLSQSIQGHSCTQNAKREPLYK